MSTMFISVTSRQYTEMLNGVVKTHLRLISLTVESKRLSEYLTALINKLDKDILCYACQGYMDEYVVKLSLHHMRLFKVMTKAKGQWILDATSIEAAANRGQLVWQDAMITYWPGRDRALMALQNVLDSLTLRLETRRAKLLYQLQLMYPIAIPTNDSSAPTQSYSIRDLHLPAVDSYASVDDDIISCALGYCCHLVLMIAKYMAIPLRYRIIYRCSRSLISKEISSIQGSADYPLYIKGIPRSRFNSGVILLNRLVEQILASRGLGQFHRQLELGSPRQTLNSIALYFKKELQDCGFLSNGFPS
uniref:Uncharacterized protein n=1 Tax=Spongospora subterranea TaxID=70186 RepID=A0A0H5QRG7_9EUKA|eukprot:CRZ04628.1 hypothetical protein [Spongospora subterranea]